MSNIAHYQPQIVVHQTAPQPQPIQPPVEPVAYCKHTISPLVDPRHWFAVSISFIVGTCFYLQAYARQNIFSHNEIKFSNTPIAFFAFGAFFLAQSAVILFAFPKHSRQWFSQTLQKPVLVPSSQVSPSYGFPASRVPNAPRRRKCGSLLMGILPAVALIVYFAASAHYMYPIHHLVSDWSKNYESNFNHSRYEHYIHNNTVLLPGQVNFQRPSNQTEPAPHPHPHPRPIPPIPPSDDSTPTPAPPTPPPSPDDSQPQPQPPQPPHHRDPKNKDKKDKKDKKDGKKRDEFSKSDQDPTSNTVSPVEMKKDRSKRHSEWDSNAWRRVEDTFIVPYFMFVGATVIACLSAFVILVMRIRQFRTHDEWIRSGCPTSGYLVGTEVVAPVITYTISGLDNSNNSANPPVVQSIHVEAPPQQHQQQPRPQQIVHPAPTLSPAPIAVQPAPIVRPAPQQQYVAPVVHVQPPSYAPPTINGYQSFVDQEQPAYNPNIQQSYQPISHNGSINYGGY